MQLKSVRPGGHSILRRLAACAVFCVPMLAPAQEQEIQYVATPLSATVTMLQGAGGNVAVSHGMDGVYLIDDQLKPQSAQLLAEVRKISDQPIRFVINTHYHYDHMGGNEAAGEAGAVIIAHDNVRQRLTTEQFNNVFNSATPPWPEGALPVVTFNDRITLHLNGEAAEVIHVARGHTDGDSIVHFTGSDVIHMGDIYFHGLYPFIDLDGGGTIDGMIAAVDVALERADGDTRIIPGHGPVTGRAELAAYRDFLAAARERVKALVDQGRTLEETIAAKPTAEWDEAMGGKFISPAQFVTFIYNSLTGVDHFTRIPANTPSG